MKISKYISLVFAIAIISVLIAVPVKTIATNKSNDIIYNSEPVLANKSDFNIRLIPVSKPNRCVITKYTGKNTKIIIPDNIDGIPVTNIASGAFYDNSTIEYIKLPKSIKFCNGAPFRLTPKLKTIDVDEANPNFTSKNGFVYNKDLTKLVAAPGSISGNYTIPNGVKTIGSYAFSSRFMLTGLNMYNTVESIESYAFSYCYALSDIRLSDNLKTIGDSAFSHCELREVHLPFSLESVGNQALIGGIDSNNNVFYYTTGGIYYVPGTPAEKYVKSLDLPTEYTIAEPRTLTDIDSSITIIDNKGVLPKAGLIDIESKEIPTEELKSLAPVRYSEIHGYDFKITLNGKPFTLNNDVVIRFSSLSEGTPKTVGKVFRVTENKAQELYRDPQAPFVGTQTKNLGKFIILANNDFSIKGDIDGNGIVSIYDTRIALSHTAGLKLGLTGEQIACADMDNSGKIDTEDVRNILRKAAGIIN